MWHQLVFSLMVSNVAPTGVLMFLIGVFTYCWLICSTHLHIWPFRIVILHGSIKISGCVKITQRWLKGSCGTVWGCMVVGTVSLVQKCHSHSQFSPHCPMQYNTAPHSHLTWILVGTVSLKVTHAANLACTVPHCPTHSLYLNGGGDPSSHPCSRHNSHHLNGGGDHTHNLANEVPHSNLSHIYRWLHGFPPPLK